MFYNGDTARIKQSCLDLKYRGCQVTIVRWSGGTYSHKEPYYIVTMPGGGEGLIAENEIEELELEKN